MNHDRQITGLDGPSASVAFAQSFPQPADADEDEVGVAIAERHREDDESQDNVRISLAEGETQKRHVKDYLSDHPPKKTDHPDRPQSLLKPHDVRHRKTDRRKDLTQDSKGQPKKQSSFVTAPLRRKPFSGDSATSPPLSFHTAHTSVPTPRKSSAAHFPTTNLEPIPSADGDPPRISDGDSYHQARTSDLGNSKTALLGDGLVVSTGEQDHADPEDRAQGQEHGATGGLVKFNTDNLTHHSHSHTLSKLDKESRRHTWKRRKGENEPGSIIKAEKMLVRVDTTMKDVPPDYNENLSLAVETRTVEKWREFMVVCREGAAGEVGFSLQLYKTRVIPAKTDTHVKAKWAYEIPLLHRSTTINLYSPLDKTLVISKPAKVGTQIYILRAHSASSAVEWYTFLRQSLGWKRSTTLQVNVPDLSVSLQLKNPFGNLEASISDALREKSDQAVMKTMEAEKAVASMIIHQALEALKDNPEWSNVLDQWLAKEKIGLAWKRYDRLEWVHGANEQKMYGTLAMQKTHELELRPKEHYPTGVKKRGEVSKEPPPVEGFLIRLTSIKGNVRKLGRMYFKRLYFTTHNQYLCYTRPAKAEPPPPPSLSARGDDKIPESNEIIDNAPLIFAVNPYPIKDGKIEWLDKSAAIQFQHDEEAYRESERKIKTMLHAEGYINLLHVARVQNAKRGNTAADANVDSGSEVDFHEEVADTTRDDGKIDTFDDHRTFELVMKNNLIIRLQAYDEKTKDEWMHRLRKLIRYWKLRLKDDMLYLKSIRDENLERLGIDEEMEASLGQYASKWEVVRSVASPKIFHMCGISCCRAITQAGTLYHKPKRRSTFLRSGVILCHGKLLIFHGTLRKASGEEVPHIQHNRHTVLDLADCYIYSGLLTEGDLLYQNKTFDANHPGHHALPRMYLDDGWTSIDEDTMTTFVIWQPRNKSWFRAKEEDGVRGTTKQKLRHVSRLGAPGRSVVFKARSRAERDHWVTSIAMEIERVQASSKEDIRVVNS